MHKIPSSNPIYVSGIEAAEAAEITYGALLHWVRTGRVQRYERTRSEAAIRRTGPVEIPQYWFNLDEVLAATVDGAEAALRRAHPEKRFITAYQLTDLIDLKYSAAIRVIRLSGVQKFKYYGKDPRYMFDLHELLAWLDVNRLVDAYLVRNKLGLL
jgi:hypothetical protein